MDGDYILFIGVTICDTGRNLLLFLFLPFPHTIWNREKNEEEQDGRIAAGSHGGGSGHQDV